MSLWLLGFVVGLVVVLLVAALLIGILVEATRIRRLARQAGLLVREIDSNTRGIWALRDTSAVALALLRGAEAIDGNAAAIVRAVSDAHIDQDAA
ncbi:MAG: hypothetical protein NVSMB18_30190 [Acetobacteraceae bacterium]